MASTVWKAVDGFEGRYEVSDLGEVKSYRRYSEGRLLTPRRSKDIRQYLKVGLRDDAGVTWNNAVHVLVAKAFHGPRPEKHQAAHKNGDMYDNRAENIAWKTCPQNNQDKIAHGTVAVGERNGNSKLSDQAVKEIRAAWADRYRGLGSELMTKYDISRATLHRVTKGISHKHAAH